MGDLEETWAEALEFTSEFTPEAFTRLTESMDPAWFEEALLTTGMGTIRLQHQIRQQDLILDRAKVTQRLLIQACLKRAKQLQRQLRHAHVIPQPVARMPI